MTKEHDFKQLVRARMAETGENYTRARAALLADDATRAVGLGTHPGGQREQDPEPTPPTPRPETAYERARREQETVVGRMFRHGRLVNMPVRRKLRVAVLLEMLRHFEPGRAYPEKEVNEILGAMHDDYAYWRRELVNYRYLTRADGIYRVADAVPAWPEHLTQESSDWERVWLPRFLAGEAG